MRVLAVAHILLLLERKRELVGEFDTEFLLHIVGNHSIVYAGVTEYFIGQFEAEFFVCAV